MDTILNSGNIPSNNPITRGNLKMSTESHSEDSSVLHGEGSEHGSDMVFEKPLLAPYAVHQASHTSTKKASAVGLQAPYAQPVLDGSKMPNERKSKQRFERTSVDEKIQLVQERRKHQQAQHERSLREKKRKSETNILRWEEGQREKHEQQAASKQRESERRKEIEARREMLMEETMKRAKAAVAKTEQQATVVMREKRNRSVDRGKRWSWGADVDGDSGGQRQRGRSTTPSGPIHRESTDQPSVRRSVDTSHMNFASGLRSSPSSKGIGKGHSQGSLNSTLTEPNPAVSPRLLAPTRSSLAKTSPGGVVRSRSLDRRSVSKERPTSSLSLSSTKSARSASTRSLASPTLSTRPVTSPGSDAKPPSPSASRQSPQRSASASRRRAPSPSTKTASSRTPSRGTS